MANTLLFHDYETFGADPKRDRPSQFAAIRTDEDLNEIDEPIMIYAKMQEDTLPAPMACMITKITPSEVDEKGIPEYEFINKIVNEMSKPNTCSLGYNTINFDDEVTRNTLYRNLKDPYEREFRNGCSRWDLIDVVRLSVAIYPDIIKLGNREGKVSYKLEDLSKENGILHEAAHDALSDVRATIGIAKIIKDKAPMLFEKLFEQRAKNNVKVEVESGKPLLIASSFFGSEHKYVDFVLPITPNPNNLNEYFCLKLTRPQEELSNLMNNSSELIKELLFSTKEELEEKNEIRPALHTIRINKCPVLISTDTLRDLFPNDNERKQLYENLGFEMDQIIQSYKMVVKNKETIKEKLLDVYKPIEYPALNDCDIEIYNGFPSNNDKKSFTSFAKDLKYGDVEKYFTGVFEKDKYKELAFRIVARNYPEKLAELGSEYESKWKEHCQNRLFNKVNDSVSMNFDEYFQEIKTLKVDERFKDDSYQRVLNELENYGNDLKQKFQPKKKLSFKP